MFFNRFRLEREEDFCILHFGFVSSSGVLMDRYSCVLPRQTLEQNQNSLVTYLGRIGQPNIKSPALSQGVPPAEKIDVADTISMAFRDDMAETCFALFSLTAATRVKASSVTDFLEAQPLVLLRSTSELQKQLIVALYEE